MTSSHCTLHERLARSGSQSLSDEELLTLVLAPGAGTRKEAADEEISRLLLAFGGLASLLRADFEALRQEARLTGGKAAKLRAALELAKRLCDFTRFVAAPEIITLPRKNNF